MDDIERVEKFVSIKDLEGNVGFSLISLPGVVLRSWGFDTKQEITRYDQFDPPGWLFVQYKTRAKGA